MRCLGRLVFVVVVAVLLIAAWVYRANLKQVARNALAPTATGAVGRPSAGAERRAMLALDSLQRPGVDSVLLTSDEMAALLTRGAPFLPGETRDSLTVRLGDRRLDVRTVIDSARIPVALRRLIPGHLPAYESLEVSGIFMPVQPGQGEFDVSTASVHGVPLPRPLVRDLAHRLSGRDGEHMTVSLPAAVAGFRVRPSGVAIYRQRPAR